MRKIVAGLFVSVDGVVEAPDAWTGPYFSPEVGQLIESMMADGDTLLLGRVTYQGFADSFGGQTGGGARRVNKFEKVGGLAAPDQAQLEKTDPIGGHAPRGIPTIKRGARPGHDQR